MHCVKRPVAGMRTVSTDSPSSSPRRSFCVPSDDFETARVCVFVIGIYAFALQGRFENTIKGTLRNALGLALGNLPRSLAMAAVWA